ncbi:methyltransferase [Lentzea sp. CC55]|uniref:methyltransferase n=1 Tax=Lentzea sp. CC55 TaxID=2884909 RepID=UPI0027E00FE8|nr:methyltransferase [Lentzea sp. CC55]MCG8923716.1 hypothetical protein [Lentzea sp. CC55]
MVAAVGWSRFGTLVDVGGGHGGLLAAVLEANPGTRGHPVDLEDSAAAPPTRCRPVRVSWSSSRRAGARSSTTSRNWPRLTDSCWSP